MDSDPPDFVDAARDAILAVENVANLTAGKEKGTLGDAIKELRGKQKVGPPLSKALEAISGFRGSTPGLMHSSLEKLKASELRFAINLSMAAIIWLDEVRRRRL